jgi:glycosyltransferase involved in cell wall biosynthesis
LKILVVSNFYPPNHIGGYELGCSRIVGQLRNRGHDCIVLTSNFGPKMTNENEVFRTLEHSFNETDQPQRLGGVRSLALDIVNRRKTKKLIQSVEPDLIFIFNPMYLTPGVLVEASSSNIPNCCLVSDEWLCNWNKKGNRHYSRLLSLKKAGRWGEIPTRIYGALGLSSDIDLPEFDEIIFVSEYLGKKARGSGVDTQQCKILHWGIDRQKYLSVRDFSKPPKKMLFCGQISPHKGPETAIRAMSIVKARRPDELFELTIAGASKDHSYYTGLEQLVLSLGLEESVNFLGTVTHREIPELMREHDIFIFTSIWQEPFSIVLVEALTSGLAVVTTSTGGTPEIVVDGTNGLFFDANDPENCAARISQILEDPGLFKKLSTQAVKSTADLTIRNMTDEIERYLLNLTVNAVHVEQ